MRYRTKEVVRGGSKEALKLLGASAFMAAVFSPHAANHAIETTEVDTMIGEFPVSVSYQPGTSSLDILNTGNIYVDETYAGIGIKADMTGLPTMKSDESIRDIISPERAAIYTSLADNPDDVREALGRELRDATIESVFDYLKWPVLFGGIGLYGAGSAITSRNRLRKRDGERELPFTRGYVAGLAVTSLAFSGALATEHRAEWQDSLETPSSLTRISALDNTSFAGATTDNPTLLSLVNQAAEYSKVLNTRREEDLSNYLGQALPALEDSLSQLEGPRENEELIFVVTDIHGSVAGTRLAQEAVHILKERFGSDSLAPVINIGDMIYEPELQRDSIRGQASINPDGNVVLAPGNHDIGNAIRYAEEDGMIVLDGHEEIDGLTIYGKADPQQTPFLGRSYFVDPEVTEETLGQETYEDLEDQPADVVALHQPAAIAALLDLENIQELPESTNTLTTCDPREDIRDIPAGLIAGGHHHDNYPIRMLCNSDGTWTVLGIQGTGGGADESPTINNWSDPSASPQKDISYRVFYRNTVHGSITGYADIVITTGASAEPVERIDIGTPDGAPFEHSGARNKNNQR